LESLTAAEEREAVAEIESLGYGAIWFPESVESREGFAHAGWILASTERALAVSGIANVWARDPTAMANGWRMLSDAYPGRFVLGIGVSHAGSVARRGGTYERPYTAMRGFLDAMDRAPSSAPEPELTPRLVLAALGPRVLGRAAHATPPTPQRPPPTTQPTPPPPAPPTPSSRRGSCTRRSARRRPNTRPNPPT